MFYELNIGLVMKGLIYIFLLLVPFSLQTFDLGQQLIDDVILGRHPAAKGRESFAVAVVAFLFEQHGPDLREIDVSPRGEMSGQVLLLCAGRGGSGGGRRRCVALGLSACQVGIRCPSPGRLLPAHQRSGSNRNVSLHEEG